MSAAPYFPFAAAGSLELTAVPVPAGFFTIFHFIGGSAESLGPSQYVQLLSRLSLDPSNNTIAPSGAVTPIVACCACKLSVPITTERKNTALNTFTIFIFTFLKTIVIHIRLKGTRGYWMLFRIALPSNLVKFSDRRSIFCINFLFYITNVQILHVWHDFKKYISYFKI